MIDQDIQDVVPAQRAVPVARVGVPVRKAVSLRSTSLAPGARAMAGEDRQRLIAEAAYFRAERRGFAPGQELEDWLAAEIEIDALFGDDES